MEIAEISSKLTEFFHDEFPNPGVELTPSTNLTQDWFVDSFGILNTILFLEKNFGIKIQRADINAENFKNVDSLSRYVQTRLTSKE